MNFNRNLLGEAVRLSLALGTVGVVGLAATPAFAQSDDETATLDRIEVTGSRIQRVDVEGPNPITVISRENLEAAGELSVADFLRNNVYNSYGSIRESSGSATGSFAAVSLRGLGSQYTLVLLDGRRMTKSASQDGAAANMNMIPTAAIERIEILREGAGAIYGSDAIGGVINIILRKDYEGASVSAGIERPSIGPDGNTASVSAGVSSDRGNVTFVVDHGERDLIYNREILGILADNGFSPQTPGLATAFLSAFNSSANFFNPTVGLVGAPGCGAFQNSILQSNGTCRFNHMATSANEASLRRDSLLVNANYELTDDVTFFLRTISSSTESFGVYAAAPVDTFPTISADNQFNPFGLDGTLYYRFTPLGTRDTTIKDQYRDINFGLQGVNDLFGGSNWEIGFGHGRVSQSSVGQNYGIGSILQDLIDSGDYNPFDPNHPSVAAAAPLVAHTVYVENEQRTVSVDGSIGFDLFEMDGRPVSFVAGFDYLDDRLEFQYDAQSAAGNVFGSAGAGLGGERAQYAVYFESLIPLLDTLNMTVAGRYDSYNDIGSKFSPRVSLEFRPVDTLLFRGSWGKGFRAPTMGDLYGATSSTNVEVPPLASQGLRGGDQLACDALTAVRAATGDASYQPYPVDPCGTNAQYQVLLTSNPNLGPEESTNWGVGIVFNPIENLNIALDYFNVEIEGQISNVPLVLALQYGDEGRPSYGVDRGGSIVAPNGTVLPGPVRNFLLPIDNAAMQETQGVDLEISYMFDMGTAGSFSPSFTWTHVLADDFTPPFADTIEQAGTFGAPENRAQLNLGWSLGDFGATIIGNYIDGHEDVGVVSIPSWTTWDAQANWNTPWDGRVTLGVRNIGEKLPPFNTVYGSPFYDNSLYNIWGRVPYMRYEQNF